MASMFTSFGIAKGFAAASILAVVGSVPAAAQLGWDQSTAPIKYLEYNLPYYKLPLVPLTAYTYSRPEHRLAFGRYKGLYNYVPRSVADAPPMVGAATTPFIGYDLTPC
jgi:hypothetical protein